ncbi:MAG: hypothetical protein ACJATV_000363 [Granulosicoccus sp.]|jgi:hypothetical protein
MDWRFIDNDTLQEHDTDYVIQLVSGTWFNPKEIRPIINVDMSFLKQAQLLRCGLEYVTALCHSQEEAGVG